MSEQVRILSFYENWRDLKKMFTNDEWCELEEIIWALRFDGIDTDPKTISNMKIQMAWNLIRPSILKSNRNTRYQEKKKADVTTNTEVEKPLTTGLPNTINDEVLDRDLDIIVDYQVNNKPQDDLSKEAIGRVNKQMNVLNGDERLNFEYRISEIMENKRQKIWNTVTT
jgi:hypothetical protein